MEHNIRQGSIKLRQIPSLGLSKVDYDYKHWGSWEDFVCDVCGGMAGCSEREVMGIINRGFRAHAIRRTKAEGYKGG